MTLYFFISCGWEDLSGLGALNGATPEATRDMALAGGRVLPAPPEIGNGTGVRLARMLKNVS